MGISGSTSPPNHWSFTWHSRCQLYPNLLKDKVIKLADILLSIHKILIWILRWYLHRKRKIWSLSATLKILKTSFFPSKLHKGICHMISPTVKELLKTRFLTTHYLIMLDLKAELKIKPQHSDNTVTLPLSQINCIAYPHLCSFTRRCKCTTKLDCSTHCKICWEEGSVDQSSGKTQVVSSRWICTICLFGIGFWGELTLHKYRKSADLHLQMLLQFVNINLSLVQMRRAELYKNFHYLAFPLGLLEHWIIRQWL